MNKKEKIESFTWTLRNVKQIYEDKIPLRSSTFSREINSSESKGLTDWQILITTNEPNLAEKTQGLKNVEFLKTSSDEVLSKETLKLQYVALFLQTTKKVEFKLPILKITFSIIHPFDGKIFSRSKTVLKFVEGQLYGFPDFISIGELETLKQEDLVILCELEKVKKDVESYKFFLQSKMFSDVKLLIGDQTYPAHKGILAISSPVFREKFTANESLTSLQLEDIEPIVFIEVLRFIYTGKILKLEEYASEIFKAADSYKILDLTTECKNNLTSNLKVATAIRTLVICNSCSAYCDLETLEKLSLNLLIKNFQTIMKSGSDENFTKVDSHLLIDILLKVCDNLQTSKCRKLKIFNTLEGPAAERFCQIEFESFLNNKTFSDIEIHVKDKIFYAHKLVLASRSHVFKRMFSENMAESISSVIEVEDEEPDNFYELLRFVYTNKFDQSGNISIWRLLINAHKYEIDDLKFDCENILHNQALNSGEILFFLFHAENSNAERLKDFCFWYIIDNILLNKKMREVHKKQLYSLGKSSRNLILQLFKKLVSDYKLVFDKNYC